MSISTGMCANLIKSLSIIKPEFAVLFPSRLLSMLEENIHHKGKEMFSEDLIQGKYVMYHIVRIPGVIGRLVPVDRNNTQNSCGFPFLFQSVYIDLFSSKLTCK